jgi:hypothetical protein
VNQANNIFNQPAYNILFPMDKTNVPPLIPPQPRACVAASPYSTQTSNPSCT